MTRTLEILADSRFVKMVKLNEPEKGIKDYFYLMERPGIVAVLPFRRAIKDDIVTGFEYLIRSELCPPWGTEQQFWTCITGGCDGDSPEEAAKRETVEEGGFTTLTVDQMIPLGQAHGSKAVDAYYHLFAVDVTGMQQVQPEGDGSELENVAFNEWVDTNTMLRRSADALVYAAFCRLELLRSVKG